MALTKILERSGFKESFEEEFRKDSTSLASAPHFFEALKDKEKAAQLKNDFEKRDFVLTSSFQLIEDKGTFESKERGTIVHSSNLGVYPVHNVEIPWTDHSANKLLPDSYGGGFFGMLGNSSWLNYVQSLLGTNAESEEILEAFSRISDINKFLIAVPRLERRKGTLRTMITFNRIDIKNNNYFVIGSIYDPNSTIAYPLVEVPD